MQFTSDQWPLFTDTTFKRLGSGYSTFAGFLHVSNFLRSPFSWTGNASDILHCFVHFKTQYSHFHTGVESLRITRCGTFSIRRKVLCANFSQLCATFWRWKSWDCSYKSSVPNVAIDDILSLTFLTFVNQMSSTISRHRVTGVAFSKKRAQQPLQMKVSLKFWTKVVRSKI